MAKAAVQPIIGALHKRDALPAAAYIRLLDWLDKIRIGVWPTRHLIGNHPIKITPNFHADIMGTSILAIR